MRATLWVGMMVLWLAALVSGVWWVWPHFERLALTADLLMSIVWLLTGACAWLVALSFGLRRFWRR